MNQIAEAMTETRLDLNKALLAINSLRTFHRSSLVVPGLRRTGIYKDLVGICKDDGGITITEVGSEREPDFEVLRVLIYGGLTWMKMLSNTTTPTDGHDYKDGDSAADEVVILPLKVCSAMQRRAGLVSGERALASRNGEPGRHDVFVPNRAFLHRVWQFYHAGCRGATTTTTLSFEDRMAWTVALVQTLVDAGGAARIAAARIAAARIAAAI